MNRLLILKTLGKLLLVEIGPILSVKRFDSVPLSFTGTGDGLAVDSETHAVSVTVTGPKLLFDTLKAAALKAYVSLEGLAQGTYALPVMLSIRDMDSAAFTYTITPQNVNATLSAQ